MKKIYILSDGHLGEDKELYEVFFEEIKNLKKNSLSHFIVLGDLFRFFIGMKKWVKNEEYLILEEFLKLKKEGIFTAFLEGNRDFFLEKKFLSPYFDYIGDNLSLKLNKITIFLTHGDKVNKKDKGFIFWNKFSKSFILYFLTKNIPSKFLLPFYDFLEKKLKNVNFKYRKFIPEEEILKFAKNLKEDYIIMGHFHIEKRIKFGEKEIILLPAFKDTKKFWTFEYED